MFYHLGLFTQILSVNTSVQRPASGMAYVNAFLLQFALLTLLLKLYGSKKRSFIFPLLQVVIFNVRLGLVYCGSFLLTFDGRK